MCELQFVAVRLFWCFCFSKDRNTAPSAVCSEQAEAGERCLWAMEDLESGQTSFYCRFYVFFLKSLLLDVCSGLLVINS